MYDFYEDELILANFCRCVLISDGSDGRTKVLQTF